MKKMILVIMVMVLGMSLLACGKEETVEEKSFIDEKLEDIRKDTEDLKEVMIEEIMSDYVVIVREIFEEELANGYDVEADEFGVTCNGKTVSWEYVSELAFNSGY